LETLAGNKPTKVSNPVFLIFWIGSFRA